MSKCGKHMSRCVHNVMEIVFISLCIVIILVALKTKNKALKHNITKFSGVYYLCTLPVLPVSLSGVDSLQPECFAGRTAKQPTLPKFF